MLIDEERKGQIVILKIHGRLDSTNSTELDAAIANLVNQNEKAILLDCQQLDYVSSAGLRVFLKALKSMSTSKGKLLLCCLKEPIREIFDISGFSGIFSIYETQEKALSRF
ncbi:MAG: STAS domain-containing protein [Candidatus Latescibacteria bacterium]|nr:STAS domain-containing protein [Candidatus Latescibacterota bacterium]